MSFHSRVQAQPTQSKYRIFRSAPFYDKEAKFDATKTRASFLHSYVVKKDRRKLQ